MGRATRALLLLSGALVVGAQGCSPADPVSTSDAGNDTGTPFQPDSCKPSLAAGATASVSVGEGMTFYRDIPDGTQLTWEKGPQGGHHVWIALRQRGLRLRGTIITIDLEDVEDPSAPKLVNHSKLVYDFDKDEGGFCSRPGLRMQLDNAGGVTLEALLGHKVRVTATLRDEDGAVATGARTIVVTGALD